MTDGLGIQWFDGLASVETLSLSRPASVVETDSTVSKTVIRLMTYPGFESMALRHLNLKLGISQAYEAPVLTVSLLSTATWVDFPDLRWTVSVQDWHQLS